MEINLGKYQHFDGHLYEVIGTAQNAETNKEMVIYQALFNHPRFGEDALFVRSVKSFMEEVEKDEKKIPRFKFIE